MLTPTEHSKVCRVFFLKQLIKRSKFITLQCHHINTRTTVFETVHKVVKIVYAAMSSFIYQHKAQFLLINTTRQQGNSSSQYKAKKEDEMSSNKLNLSDILLLDIERPIPLCIVKEKR